MSDLLSEAERHAVNEIERLTAALEQAQQLRLVTAGIVTQQDELLNMHSERIEQLEAALNDLEKRHSDAVDAWNREIERNKALQSAGDSGL